MISARLRVNTNLPALFAPVLFARALFATLALLASAVTPAAAQTPEIPLPPAAAAQSQRPAVLVELQAEPAALVYARALGGPGARTVQTQAAAVAAGRDQVTAIRAQQTQVAATLAGPRFGAAELYRVQRAMNGIAVRVNAADLEAIRRLPGVKRVHLLTLEFPNNAISVPFIGAPPLWNNSLGLSSAITGAGVRVGIIDTGIDYQHADFGGSGLLADYQANDRTVAPDAYFPTAKLIGGTDLAGDAYDGNTTPVPDADPMDCNGHGTHVAGSAAGLGVNADGTTYAGPYGPATPFSSLRIGPGVAPGASLYAIRVFGCTGGTNLTVQAIDWAMDPNGDSDLSDHLDVINLSLGSEFGGLTDTSAIAADNAAAAGVIVVAAAGNSGDTFFIVGSPGSGRRVLTVAAAADNGVAGNGVRVNAPGSITGVYSAQPAAAFGSAPPVGGLTGDVVIAVDPADGAGPSTTDGCSPLTNAAAVAGNIALIDRGTCAFTQKATNAQNAGAIGVIFANNGGPFGPPGGTDPTVTIPAVMIDTADAATFKANIAGLNVTLLTAGDTVASFSSRGPVGSGTTSVLKPDLAAPGVSITSAQTGVTCTTGSCQTPDGSGFLPGSQPLVLSGTSMATPHAAGVMALLRQLHPDWTVEELKALAMNTAIHDVTTLPDGGGVRYGPARIGAGRVDASLAAQASVVAFADGDSGEINVSFDVGEVVGTVSAAKTVRVVNHSAAPQTFDLNVDTVVDANGIAFSLPGGSTLTVPPGESALLTVQVDANASQMTHTRDASVAATQGISFASLSTPQPRHWITEEAGYLTLSQSGVAKLRLPLYLSARPASTMSGPTAIVTGGAPTGATTIPLSGVDVCTGTLNAGPVCNGTFPNDEASLVTPFELQVISPRDPTIPAATDLQYAGVATSASTIWFGLSTWGDWASASEVSFAIYVDNNNNGTYDRVIFSTNTGNLARLVGTTDSPTDVHMSAVFSPTTNGVNVGTFPTFINRVSPGIVDTALYRSNVMFIAATPAQLGLANTNSPFRYRIETCPGSTPLCQSLSGFHYDEANGPYAWTGSAGLSFGGSTLASDLNGSALPVTWNTANMAANGSFGVLLLHHHNVHGQRAQVIPMDTAAHADLGVTMTANPPSPSQGEQVTLTITATNNGPNAATSVRAVLDLPAGLTYVSDDAAGAYDSNLGIWTVGSIASGATATFHVVATVDVPAQLVTASVTIGTTALLDPNPSNDQATVNFLLPSQADLRVTVQSAVGPVTVGGQTIYTVQVTNIGTQTAYNVNVLNSLTAGTGTIQSGTASAGIFTAGTGRWQLASLGKDATETLTMTVLAAGGPILTARAQGSSDIADPVSVNNVASADIAVSGRTTTTSLAVASPITLGSSSSITVTVIDTQIGGGAINPAGQVTIASSVVADQFTSSACALAPVAATLDRSSCQVTITPATSGARTLTATYAGNTTHAGSIGSGSLTVNTITITTTTTVTSDMTTVHDGPQTIMLRATVTGNGAINAGTVTFTLKDAGMTVIGTPVTSATVSNGAASVGYILPGGMTPQTLTIVASYSGSAMFAASIGSGTLTVVEQTTYALAEGATGVFFHTDLALANPNSAAAPITIDFLKEDGSTVTHDMTLPGSSQTTLSVETIPGMASASFSTVVTSISRQPLLVERTMHWDASGYGAHTEKANEGVASTWYFAEGSQGFFHTYFLLLNPHATPNVAHVTYVFEDATTVQRDYPLGATSRLTIDAGADTALVNRSFGATVVFDQPGMAERSMYFGSNPTFSGGSAAAGVNAPATTWYMAEGATGTFFNTFVLIANPGDQPANATVTYFLEGGGQVVKQHPLNPHQRLTINVADEDPLLASAAFGTTVVADQPVVVERSQYWPAPDWYESHNSMAVFALGTKWGLAEGRVGGADHAQTYILVSNPNTQPATLTVSFLRTQGTPLVKTFTVNPGSRFNIAITGADSVVPELADESFGTVIASTQPVLVERSLYSDANGVIWAAGTNATATRLP